MVKKWPFMSNRFLEFFLPKLKKSWNRNICVLCYSFWSNQDLDMFSTSKWPSAVKFFERYLCSWQKMTRNDPKMAKLKGCIFYIVSEYILWSWFLETKLIWVIFTNFSVHINCTMLGLPEIWLNVQSKIQILKELFGLQSNMDQ